LNQIGRHLTEKLEGDPAKSRRHQLLMMLDEFPALGRLDFFESALAFMAGYGIKGFLIAQSLNQIEKAYGPNNAILDNCHVRVSFASNDERTAKRISDALGTATEMRAMKNYAGHRLSPWLGHLMVSRTETARALLTPGEVMQLPPDEEIVMAAGLAPIHARKARYYQDNRFTARLLPAPGLPMPVPADRAADDWTALLPPQPATPGSGAMATPLEHPAPSAAPDDAEGPSTTADPANAGIRQEPELPQQEEVASKPARPQSEFVFDEPDEENDALRNRRLQERLSGIVRQASLDPDDGIAL
jgi:type IV secretion system protein VirD4